MSSDPGTVTHDRQAMPSRADTWHGITWATGVPTLLLTDTQTRSLDRVPVVGRRLGIAVTSQVRYCTGRYAIVDTTRVQPVPCATQDEALPGDSQCRACQRSDEFRYVHRAHQGGEVPPAARAYLAQPHWLYIATFANAASKVGTAAAPRKRSRLDEQGPIFATYLAQTPDGVSVRHLEDAVGTEAGLPQTVRGATKLAALTNVDTLRVEAVHLRSVNAAVAALSRMGIAAAPQRWQPPAESRVLLDGLGWPPPTVYPHELREGEHGFHVLGCLGTTLLFRLTSHDDAPTYIADLSAMSGQRVQRGSYTSPPAAIQSYLF